MFGQRLLAGEMNMGHLYAIVNARIFHTPSPERDGV
jgi:hypothetical protein